MNNRFQKLLILSDYDGTFAGRDSCLVPRNLEAITRFQAQGGHFSFSTGRLPSVMKELCPSFRSIANAPLILCNGALLYDPKSDSLLGEWVFDGMAARHMVRDILARFPSVRFTVYSDDAVLLENLSPEAVPGNRWRKINFFARDEETAIAVRDYLAVAYADRYRAFRSFAICTEVVDRSISKGKRIEDLRAYYRTQGIDGLTIYAIGDYENDIDMLRHADRAYCPANAIEPVKTICHRVLGHHDNGCIADLIEAIEAGEA